MHPYFRGIQIEKKYLYIDQIWCIDKMQWLQDFFSSEILLKIYFNVPVNIDYN